MKSTIVAILTILISLVTITGCIDAPSFDEVPFISNARIQTGSSPIDPFADTSNFVTLVFDFQDGDGDIGRETPESAEENLFLENTQLDTIFIETNFSIPYIPPIGGVPDITGTIRVQLNISTFQGFCLAQPDLTQIEYRLWIMDRSGNQSNIIDVPAILVDCE